MNKELRRHDAALVGDAMELSNLRSEVALLRKVYLRASDVVMGDMEAYVAGERVADYAIYDLLDHLENALYAYDGGKRKEF